MSASYQCIASGVHAYDRADEAKGTVVETFEPPQSISAQEHRSQGGCHWLRLSIHGRYAYAPWTDTQGKPYWALTDDHAYAEIGKTSGGQTDALLCGERGCSHAANDKCTRCGKFICLVHKTRYFTRGVSWPPGQNTGQWATCCEACLRRHSHNTRLCWWLSGMIVLAVIAAVLIYLFVSGHLG